MLFVVNELVSDSNRGFEVFLFFIRKGLERMKTNEAIEDICRKQDSFCQKQVTFCQKEVSFCQKEESFCQKHYSFCQKPAVPALNAKPLNHSKPTNKQINASTNQRSSKDRNMSGNRPLCLPITIFPYFLLIESTKDQGMNNGNLPALGKQRKSMQGPVKHNALPSCFGWVWQSNLSLGRI